MSFFITSYRTLAEWRSVIERLDGFNVAVSHARAAAVANPSVAVSAGESETVTIDDLLLRLPQGTPLAVADDIAIAPGERVLVTGPSGAGKSTLFRAMAGRWPFGRGAISIPKGANLLVLPQRPYFPLGTLAAAVTYPAEPGAFGRDRLAETIAAAGLPALAARLDEEAHWNRMLSLGEQQRLGVARALLQAPDILLLDEATASLDEPAEAAVYELIAQRLPNATVISIGHRSTLAAFHHRLFALVRQGSEPARLSEGTLSPATG
jgi:putative ATP-binding cassette transporter